MTDDVIVADTEKRTVFENLLYESEAQIAENDEYEWNRQDSLVDLSLGIIGMPSRRTDLRMSVTERQHSIVEGG